MKWNPHPNLVLLTKLYRLRFNRRAVRQSSLRQLCSQAGEVAQDCLTFKVHKKHLKLQIVKYIDQICGFAPSAVA